MSDARLPTVATDDFVHLRGDEARSGNIAAARGVAETLRSTLGPTGLDKMLVSSGGSVTITNDGETVLKRMDVDHPAARAIVEVAKSQGEQVGDGTTTAVLLASELLQAAEDLLDAGTHPIVVVDGYQRALDRAVDALDDLAEPIEVDGDERLLRRVATSSLTGKAVTSHADPLASLVLDATAAVTVDATVDLDYLAIRSRPGAGVGESALVRGAVLEAEPRHDAMPTTLPDASVLLLKAALGTTEPETEVRATIDTAEGRKRFLERDERLANEVVDRVVELGADVVFCDKRVDDRLAARLAERGVLAVEHVKRSDVAFEFLQEVTGATAVTEPRSASPAHLGRADVFRDGWFRVENPDTHGVTLVVRGSTEHVAAEAERGVRDAVDVVARTISDGRLLPGGGAPEVELAMRLREYGRGLDGRAGLAVDAFADALEVVPRTLARNAGLDPVDVLVELRSAHADGRNRAGLNVTTGSVENTFDAEILQPAYVAEQTVYTATKAAALILKIDEVISAADLQTFEEDGGGDGSGADD